MSSSLLGLLVLCGLILSVLAVVGGVLLWQEDRFYGRLTWRQKPSLETQNHMGVHAQTAFRDALRELRYALANDRPIDAEGWVAAARRRGRWLAKTAALSEADKDLGTAAREVSEQRADLETRVINVEGTGTVGTLDQMEKVAPRLQHALEELAAGLQHSTEAQRAPAHHHTARHMAWAVGELEAVIREHSRTSALRERLLAQAATPVSEDDVAAWDDFESHLIRWGAARVPHFLRRHSEKPPLPAYATVQARMQVHAAQNPPRELAADAAPRAGDAAPASRAPSSTVLARRREQARTLHRELTLQVASYDLDFDLQLRYPQFHNRDIPEVRAMDRAARRASDEWDLIADVPPGRLAAADVAAYRAAVEAFKEAVTAADARVRLIGDAGITDEELRDLETARGLFRQISDPGNPPSLRDTYRARLVQVLRRIDGRPGSRVSFSPQSLLALEAGED